MKNFERSARTPARIPSKTSFGKPRGLAAVFSMSGGTTDVDRPLKVELLDQLRQGVGVGVHVVAVPRLAGAAMPSTVMSDATVSVGSQEKHLVFEGVR